MTERNRASRASSICDSGQSDDRGQHIRWFDVTMVTSRIDGDGTIRFSTSGACCTVGFKVLTHLKNRTQSIDNVYVKDDFPRDEEWRSSECAHRSVVIPGDAGAG